MVAPHLNKEQRNTLNAFLAIVLGLVIIGFVVGQCGRALFLLLMLGIGLAASYAVRRKN